MLKNKKKILKKTRTQNNNPKSTGLTGHVHDLGHDTEITL